MATSASNVMYPLQEELDLVNYFKNIFGAGGNNDPASAVAEALAKLSPGSVGAGTVGSGTQIGELSQDDLMGLMTEFLRGQGNYAENMRQQNVSGLYNSSTQKLMANDLTAQAALKAINANLPIKTANAQLAQNAQNANAQLAQSAQNTNAQLAQALQLAQISAAKQASATSASKTSGKDVAAAAGINALQKLLQGMGGNSKDSSQSKKSKAQQEAEQAGMFSGVKDYFQNMWSGTDLPSALSGAQDFNSSFANMSYSPDSIWNPDTGALGSLLAVPQMSTVANPNFSVDYLNQLGSYGQSSLANQDFLQSVTPVDYGFSPFSGQDYNFFDVPTWDYGNQFDFNPIDYGFGSDFQIGDPGQYGYDYYSAPTDWGMGDSGGYDWGYDPWYDNWGSDWGASSFDTSDFDDWYF